MKWFLPSLAALLALGAALLPAAQALAENHALVLSISNYSRQPLPGSAKDVDNAKEIAKLIGVPEENILVRRDKELAGDGILKAIEEFSHQVKKGDRVFVYYSGHGSSYSRKGQRGVCEKALVAQDTSFVSKDEFNRHIAKLAERAEKTFVFLDSCYSGGMAHKAHTRSMATEPDTDGLTPKFVASSPDDPCAKPANLKSRRDYEMAEAEKMPNYYLLGSAAENEVALDGGPEVGGLASSSVLKCLKQPELSDTNHDGVVTLDDIRRCAQKQVDERLDSAHQASRDFPYTSMTLTAGFGQGGNPPVAFYEGAGGKLNTPAMLKSLYEGRDATRQVGLAANRNPIRIGQDLSLTIASDKPGYLTVLAVGSSGKIYEIFPNKMDREARIEAGEPMPVPRPGKWRLPARPPAGENWILALVSDAPDRFSDLGKDAGAFKDLGNTGKSTRGIFDFLFKSEKTCAKDGRDFAGQDVDTCSKAYGAALLKVVEVD